MKLGDIYWVELPARGGHAQAGRRPAVVFQSASATAQLPTVLFLPLTTHENGLKRPSVALAFQLTVIDKQFIGAYLGTLSGAALDAVRRALDEHH